jgi:hypothetical protein
MAEGTAEPIPPALLMGLGLAVITLVGVVTAMSGSFGGTKLDISSIFSGDGVRVDTSPPPPPDPDDCVQSKSVVRDLDRLIAGYKAEKAALGPYDLEKSNELQKKINELEQEKTRQTSCYGGSDH